MITSALYRVSKELETSLFNMIGDFAGCLVGGDPVCLRFRTRKRHPRKMGCVMVRFMDWGIEDYVVRRLCHGHWRKKILLHERERVCLVRTRQLCMQFQLMEIPCPFLHSQITLLETKCDVDYVLEVA